jgi:hypothetical protein
MTRQITSARSNAVGGALSDSSFMQPMYLNALGYYVIADTSLMI